MSTLFIHKFRIRKSTVPGVKAAVDRWCEGGWRLRLVAGGWSVAAGRWWVVAAFLDLLDVEFNIQQISPLNSIEGCHAKHVL